MILIVGNCCPPATAQQASEPEILSTRIGLAGASMAAPPGRWNWLTVVVRNPTERSFDASLAFRTVSQEATGRFNLSKPFELPARSQRRVSYPVQMVVSPPGRRDQVNVEVELVASGRRVALQRRVVRLAQANTHFLGVADGTGEALTTLHGALLHPRGGPELLWRAPVFRVQIADDDLPDNPLGYDQLQSLVLIEPSRRKLRALQWYALEQWVHSGGDLIVVTGADAQLQDQPDLAAMLPVRLIGARTVTVLPSLADFSGEGLRTSEAISVSEALPRAGQVLLWDGAVPLVVRRDLGLGSVTYVAIEAGPGLADSSAYRKFWITLLERLRRPEVLDVARLEPEVPALMENFAGRKIVGIWLPLLVIGLYLSTVGGLIAWFVRGGRAASCWGWVCLASVLFTGGGYALYRTAMPQPDDSLYDLWVARGSSPLSAVRVTDYVGLLPVHRGLTRLNVAGTLQRAVPAAETASTVVTSIHGPRGTGVEFNAETGRLRTVAVQGSVAMQGLRAHGRARAAGLELTLGNESELDLTQSFVKLGRRVFPVGDLRKGQTQVLRVTPAEGLTQFADYESSSLGDDARLRRNILDRLLVNPLQLDDQPLSLVPRGAYQGTGSRSFWAGWSDRSVLEFGWHLASQQQREKPGYRRALGLVAVVPELEPIEDTFLVPKGMMHLHLPDPSAGSYYFGRSVFRGDKPVRGPVLSLHFRLPDWARPAQITDAAVFVSFEASVYRLSVFLENRQLQLPEIPSGKYRLPLEAVPEDGLIRLRLEVEPLRSSDLQEQLRGDRWLINEVDVECLCRRQQETAP